MHGESAACSSLEIFDWSLSNPGALALLAGSSAYFKLRARDNVELTIPSSPKPFFVFLSVTGSFLGFENACTPE